MEILYLIRVCIAFNTCVCLIMHNSVSLIHCIKFKKCLSNTIIWKYLLNIYTIIWIFLNFSIKNLYQNSIYIRWYIYLKNYLFKYYFKKKFNQNPVSLEEICNSWEWFSYLISFLRIMAFRILITFEFLKFKFQNLFF